MPFRLLMGFFLVNTALPREGSGGAANLLYRFGVEVRLPNVEF